MKFQLKSILFTMKLNKKLYIHIVNHFFQEHILVKNNSLSILKNMLMNYNFKRTKYNLFHNFYFLIN